MSKAAPAKTTDELGGPQLPLASFGTPCALRIVGEPIEVPLSPGAGRFTLGSAPPAECLVPRRHVSRTHARIARDGAWLGIEDVSRNGCRFQGELARRFFVRAGDVFVAGDTPLLVLDERLQQLREHLRWQLGYTAHAAVDAALIAAAGPMQTPLLLSGPAGYGPVHLARTIHEYSGRRALPLVTVEVRASDRVAMNQLARAGAGSVCVDLRGVRRASRALARALARAPARIIAFGLDLRSMRHALDWHGPVEEIATPPLAERPPGEVIAMLDVVLAEQGSAHRVGEPGVLRDLLGSRIAELAAFEWPENHDDLRRAATRLAAWAEADGVLRVRALILGVHPTTLREALLRLGVWEVVTSGPVRRSRAARSARTRMTRLARLARSSRLTRRD